MAARSFDDLRTLDDVEAYIREAYGAAGTQSWAFGSRGGNRFGFERGGKLPLAVAEPGPLIEHAVSLGGKEGLTLQQVRRVFHRLGKDRLDRGLAFAREGGLVTEAREKRPNRAGRMQEQVVLYAQGGRGG